MLPERLTSSGIGLFVVGLMSCFFEVGVNAQANARLRVHGSAMPSQSSEIPTLPPLREVIVSYAEGNGKLQLYRVKTDGSLRKRITDGQADCMMPAWSPDQHKVVYVKQSDHGLDLWMCDPNGRSHKRLTEFGANRLPAWLPDSKHVIWMVSVPSREAKDPAASSQLHIMNIETMESRPLFGDSAQSRFSNAMPTVSPDGTKVAFISDRSGQFRVWVSNLDGSEAKTVSPVAEETDPDLKLPIEQKVPSWSPDGKWLAHWEGVEMIHMSPFTGISNPERDRKIESTFRVCVVGLDGKKKRVAGRGDDPNWSPDGFLTRSFPDPRKGGANIMIDGKDGWQELPILPARTLRYGRFTWKP